MPGALLKQIPSARGSHLKSAGGVLSFKSTEKGHHWHSHMEGVFTVCAVQRLPLASFLTEHPPKPKLVAPLWPLETFLVWGPVFSGHSMR